MRSGLSLALFIIVVVAAGIAVGWLNAPSDWVWYEQLTKPSFSPPRWVFGPVWTVLYVLIGMVGWSVWIRLYDGPLALLWILQLVLNYIWSPTFFVGHQILAALVIIVALFAVILTFCLRALRIERNWEAAAFALYGLWIAFATALNVGIYALNAV